MDINEMVKGIALTKTCSIKPDKDSSNSKTVTLNIKFDGIPLTAVFDKAVSSAVIQWQNGPGRSKFDTWKHGQVVDIDFKAPGRAPQLTPIQQFTIEAKAAGIDTSDKVALKAYINKRIDEMI